MRGTRRNNVKFKIYRYKKKYFSTKTLPGGLEKISDQTDLPQEIDSG